MGGVGTLKLPLVMQPVLPKNAPLMRMVKSMPSDPCDGPVTMMSMLPAQAFPGNELSRKLPAPVRDPLATVHGSHRAPVVVLVDVVLVVVLVDVLVLVVVLVDVDVVVLVDVLLVLVVLDDEVLDVLVDVVLVVVVVDEQQCGSHVGVGSTGRGAAQTHPSITSETNSVSEHEMPAPHSEFSTHSVATASKTHVETPATQSQV